MMLVHMRHALSRLGRQPVAHRETSVADLPMPPIPRACALTLRDEPVLILFHNVGQGAMLFS